MSTTTDKYDFGMIGLGTMGRNLLLKHGRPWRITAPVLIKMLRKDQLLEQESTHNNLKGFSDVKLFVAQP